MRLREHMAQPFAPMTSGHASGPSTAQAMATQFQLTALARRLHSAISQTNFELQALVDCQTTFLTFAQSPSDLMAHARRTIAQLLDIVGLRDDSDFLSYLPRDDKLIGGTAVDNVKALQTMLPHEHELALALIRLPSPDRRHALGQLLGTATLASRNLTIWVLPDDHSSAITCHGNSARQTVTWDCANRFCWRWHY